MEDIGVYAAVIFNILVWAFAAGMSWQKLRSIDEGMKRIDVKLGIMNGKIGKHAEAIAGQEIRLSAIEGRI